MLNRQSAIEQFEQTAQTFGDCVLFSDERLFVGLYRVPPTTYCVSAYINEFGLLVRASMECGRDVSLSLPLHLTKTIANPLTHYAAILRCKELMKIDIEVLCNNDDVERLFNGYLRRGWHSVVIHFEEHGSAIRPISFEIYPTEDERRDGCHLGMHRRLRKMYFHENSLTSLERLYIESRKTLFSFCLIVSRMDLFAGGTMLGARLASDYKEIATLNLGALSHLKTEGVGDWSVLRCDESSDMQWFVVFIGPWRTRNEAKAAIRKVYSAQATWHIDEERSSIFEPRAPNFIITATTTDLRRRYNFARNPLRKFTWRFVHPLYYEVAVIFIEQDFPPYVVLEILDCIEKFWPIERVLKVRVLEGLQQSIRRVRARRTEFVMMID